MSRSFLIQSTLVFFCGLSATPAQSREIVEPSAFRVLISQAVALSSLKSYKPGDFIFNAPLVWAVSATLTENIINIRSNQFNVPLNSIAPAVRISSSKHDRATPALIAFCLEGDQWASLVSSLVGGSKSPKGLRACFSDRDHDGKLEEVFALSDRGWVGTPTRITPIGFALSGENPLPDSRLRIQFDGTQLGTSNPYFDFQVIVEGHARRFAQLEYRDESGEEPVTLNKDFHVSRSGGWPKTKSLLGGIVLITDYSGSVLKMSWEQYPKSGTFQTIENGPFILVYTGH